MIILGIILTFAILLSFIAITNSDNSFHIDKTKKHVKVSPKRRIRTQMYYHSDNLDLIEHIAACYQDKKNWRVQNIIGEKTDKTDLVIYQMCIPFKKLKFKLMNIEMILRDHKKDMYFKLKKYFKKPFMYHYIMFHSQTKPRAAKCVVTLLMLLSSGLILWQIDPTLIYINLMSSPIFLISGSLNIPQIYVINGTDTVENQIAEAVASRADEIHFDPTLSYNVVSPITNVLNGTRFHGHGATVTHALNINTFALSGSKSASYALNANASSDQDTFVLTGTSIGISPYDVLLLHDDQQLYGSFEKGELIIVDTVTEGVNTTIECKTDLIYSYTTGNNAEVEIITMLEDVHFFDINFQGDGTGDGGVAIQVIHGRNIKVQNCHFTLFDKTSTRFYTCMTVKCINNIYNRSEDNTLGYGIAWSDACYDVLTDECTFMSCKHGITHGAGIREGYVQFSTIVNCSFINSNFNTHEETGESVLISNCQIVDGDITVGGDGLDLRGGKVTIQNCRIRDGRTTGITVDDDCLNLTIVGCTIRNCPDGGIIFGDGTPGGDYTVQNCIIEDCSEHGISITHTDCRITVTGCVVRDIGKWGIYATLAASATITSNLVINPGIQDVVNREDGIYIINITDVTIFGNVVTDDQGTHTMENGIFVKEDCQNISVTGNSVSNCNLDGILVQGTSGHNNVNVQVFFNLISNVGQYGVGMATFNTGVNIVNNFIKDPTNYAILSLCDNITISSNIINGGSTHSIFLSDVQYNQVHNNYFFESGGSAIRISSGSYNDIRGNYVYNPSGSGIADNNTSSLHMTIIDNFITNSGNGVFVRGDDYIVQGNYFLTCTNAINVTSDASNTFVDTNYFYNNTNRIVDSGTNTKLPTVSIPFTRVGGTASWVDNGIDIDAAGEYARAFLQLPEHLSEIVSIDYYAVTNVTDADGMQADLLVEGGASNEPYNTHSDDDDNQTSQTTNFTANDIIYWRQTGLSTYTAGDSIMCEIRYHIADGANVATDISARNVLVRYV